MERLRRENKELLQAQMAAQEEMSAKNRDFSNLCWS